MKEIILQHRGTEDTENTGKTRFLFLVALCLCGKQVVAK